MVGKRGGSTTPAPNWRMNPKSPSAASRISESSRQQGPVSARKLANALWELNKIPSPRFSEDLSTRRSKKTPKSRPHRLSDPSHSPESERSERSRSSIHRIIMPVAMQRVRGKEHNHRASDLPKSSSLMEVDAHSQGLTPTSSIAGTKTRLKDLRNGLTSSKELLKLLSRIWGLEDQHSYGVSILSALRVELDRSRSQVGQLIQEQRLDHNEISCLKKRFMEEKSSWKMKEQDRIQSAVHSIIEELESEKKSRRRAERLNKKLGVELADTRATLAKAVKELESERRSREIVEQICNEVVRGIGEDKAEVEHLKRESAKVREELEKEREMLHLADEWREERVQMKLLEAKVQFEEKNAAVDQLRDELEAFLENNRNREENQSEGRGEVEDGNEQDQDDERGSVESDLHSIELNMESNKGYSWSYGTKAAEPNRRSLDSIDEDSGRRSFSESTGHIAEKPEKLDQDVERYVSVKKLRDRMLAATKIVLPRGLSSPTRQWSRGQSLQGGGDRVCEGLKVAEIVKAIKEGGSKARLSNSSCTSMRS